MPCTMSCYALRPIISLPSAEEKWFGLRYSASNVGVLELKCSALWLLTTAPKLYLLYTFSRCMCRHKNWCVLAAVRQPGCMAVAGGCALLEVGLWEFRTHRAALV